MKVKIDSLHVLEPGSYDFVTPGHDVPGHGMPRRCLHCRKLIRKGDIWRAHSNGQITIIFHSACEAENVGNLRRNGGTDSRKDRS